MIKFGSKLSTLCLMAGGLVAGVLPGCETLSSLQADNTAWEGHRIDELIASWGQPDRTEQLGADYLAYTWAENGTGCEKTFLVSKQRITGYTSSGCRD